MGYDLKFISKGREAGTQLTRDTVDRLVQRLSGFYTDQHHIKGIGKAVGDFLFARIDAARDPIFGCHVTNSTRYQGHHNQVLCRRICSGAFENGMRRTKG